ncbi:hypothetical protein [Paenibacillus dendritiformis]|uniref:hypothetical protein n=1 Tax=Paenibacillus dendritiformis TaxID=130049 RepID=UPI000DA83E56|nr:hypothetical protein [Paenibacillus dendritiformis]PZM67191.1 hypothetical protein DOE73_02890 [Paenibacillus dendritiformis]
MEDDSHGKPQCLDDDFNEEEGMTMLNRQRSGEKTAFQEIASYEASIDLQTDMVLVYGMDDTMEERIRGWAAQGYRVGLMTGTAWGEYQPYLNGRFDGRQHWDEGQTRANGTRLIHETDDVPYMVPTVSFADYIAEWLKKAVDAGVDSFYMEEPEFWVEAGYSPSFRREWELYYNELWQPPHQSPDAQYRASKLKAHLYARALERISSALKSYAKHAHGRHIHFYVATHSLINYCQWRIVSPESKLMDIAGIDGYIAQVWTGTSRVPNVYEGVRRERTFETAYLEYGVMQELVRGSDRSMWFLHDPIEDHPGRTWDDYEANYKKTVVASLLHPHIDHYEVTPWPHRIYGGQYLSADRSGKVPLPEAYGTILLAVIHALQHMPLGGLVGSPEQVLGRSPDSPFGEGASARPASPPGIGVLVADSCMYQRLDLSLDWEQVQEEERFASEMEHITWDAFFGLAMPLLKHGYPVRPVQLDNVRRIPHYMSEYGLLVASYEFMKPEHMDVHYGLAQWVHAGGVLLYVGDGSDPYHAVREWWNAGAHTYDSPARHLFETLGAAMDSQDGDLAITRIGRGAVAYLPEHPARFTRSADDANRLRGAVKAAWAAVHGPEAAGWTPSHALVAKRGPYVAAAVLEESCCSDSVTLNGPFVDLFDGQLSVRPSVTIRPGEQALLYDLKQAQQTGRELVLVAAAGRVVPQPDAGSSDARDAVSHRYTARGPAGVRAVLRFYAQTAPAQVTVQCGSQACPFDLVWEEASSTFALSFLHPAGGAEIAITPGIK